MAPKKGNKNLLPENCFLAPCESGKCRMNSRKNPNCFCQLGEKFWFSTIKGSHWTNLKDPEIERKAEFGYVGLKNLGATCYVNTFLQLWFNNKAFRSAIYQWRGEGNMEPIEIINEDGEMFKSISLEFGERSTDTICGNLQYLFSLLQYSERRYVDPLFFVKSLGLQTDEQQDAQEFSKLFISLLQETLSTQNERLANIIHNQFGGSYKYQTKCNNCGNISETVSKFYELDLNIKGHHQLAECMKEFLQEESLDGENKYFCSRCRMKQNATRQIILEKLPPVLNIQLLRFVFDRHTGTKKKLNTVIHFPNTIDMNQHMHFVNKEDGIYHLNAVLIHCGTSAHSGHYIAHVLDGEKDVWCRYNDESVAVMKGKSLRLGKEDDPEAIDEDKCKKSKKGDGHNSKNAYMLVYSRAVPGNIACNVPEDMMKVVSNDNKLFEEWVSFHQVIRNHSLEEGQEKQQFIQNVYPTLAVKKDVDYEWISSSWIRLWLNHDAGQIPPVDNTSLMCRHSSADPLKITSMKKISLKAADSLYNRFGVDVRLAGDSLCMICLQNDRKKEEFELKLQEDTKIINKSLKESTAGFWVSKKSLKRFKQLARQNYLLLNEEGNEPMNGVEEEATTNVIDTDNEDEKLFTFQQDIICSEHGEFICSEHGNLSLNENLRKFVSPAIWRTCVEYFPNAATFPEDTIPCESCEKKLKNSIEEKKTLKFLAKEQKQILGFLFEDSVQRINEILAGVDGTYHVILSSFITSWKKAMRLGNNVATLSADNSEMVCEHDLLLYTAEEIIDECAGENPAVFLITENEYNSLQKFFPVTYNIILTSIAMNDEEKNHHYGVTPDVCPSCRNNRLLSDAEDSRRYTAAPIFVSKRVRKNNVGDVLIDPPEVVIDNELGSMYDQEMKCYYKQEIDKKDTKNYTVSSKRLNLSGETRRSNRKRLKRGEYTLQVNSHQSLKDLKIQVLSLYAVLPIEQTLSIDGGCELDGDDRFLTDLGISPGCHIILTVEEPKKRISEESSDKPRILEAGFKGTNLLCGSQS